MAGGSGATEGGGRGGGGGARDCGKWPMRGRPPPNVSAAARMHLAQLHVAATAGSHARRRPTPLALAPAKAISSPDRCSLGATCHRRRALHHPGVDSRRAGPAYAR